MSEYYQEFENHVGKPVTDLIMSYVHQYKLKEEHASDFARNLDRQLKDKDDQKAWGHFKRARTMNGYNYEEAFKCILSDWFEGYGDKKKQSRTRFAL